MHEANHFRLERFYGRLLFGLERLGVPLPVFATGGALCRRPAVALCTGDAHNSAAPGYVCDGYDRLQNR